MKEIKLQILLNKMRNSFVIQFNFICLFFVCCLFFFSEKSHLRAFHMQTTHSYKASCSHKEQTIFLRQKTSEPYDLECSKSAYPKKKKKDCLDGIILIPISRVQKNNRCYSLYVHQSAAFTNFTSMASDTETGCRGEIGRLTKMLSVCYHSLSYL